MIVKIKKVKINNIKNVKNGEFNTNATFEKIEKADILGVYGPNGSGKTAAVEAFKILVLMLRGERLPAASTNLIYMGEKEAKLEFDFLVSNTYGEFTVNYQVSIIDMQGKYVVKSEFLSYKQVGMEKENLLGIAFAQGKDAFIPAVKKISELDEENRFLIMHAAYKSQDDSVSFVFNSRLQKIVDKYFDPLEVEIIKNISENFPKGFHVIAEEKNRRIPINFMTNSAIGIANLDITGKIVLQANQKEMFDGVISQINIVLKEIISGLTLDVSVIHDLGEQLELEVLARRGSLKLPLNCESYGVLKIISVLSSLITSYNNPDTVLVIDELDAGVFEYLLGEILEILNKNGKGQIIFTSHNLRVLEVLSVNNIWVTTTNDKNRYIQLNFDGQTDNIRDAYLRAVQLGGQKEELYNEANSYFIKKAFRKAGRL